MTPAARHRPVVLCVVDRPGWAHDRKTDALARELRDTCEIVKRYQAELTADDLARADGVLLYYWHQAERLRPLRDALRRLRERLMIGICSHVELEEEWRTPGLAALAELAGAVFVNNRRLLDEFAPALGVPVYYTPNGVATDFFRPAPLLPSPTAAFRVGWAGSLDNQGAEHRGVHEIIAPAVAALPGAELRLAAREETWRGPQEMLAFYRSLDVYVCASRSEGTPNPCLEAAACGLPLITTRVGNMPELIRDGENGFFVERDVASLTETLARLRADPDLRARVGQAARATVVESWDWRHQAARYGAMFREVLGRADEKPVRRRDLGDITGTWQEDPEFDRALDDQDRIDDR
jgi:glycosyltransferase involved in cell wall biosynthesis